MKKLIIAGAVISTGLYLQAKLTKDPSKKIIKKSGGEALMLVTAIVCGGYLLVK